MEHYPAYTWQGILDESSLVTAFLFQRIPGIHLKRAWPSAQLQAFVGNAMGGKSKGGGKTPEWKIFTPQELLPWFAQTEELRTQQFRLEPHHCALVVGALEDGHLRNASWVVQLLEAEDNLERIQKVGEEYRRLIDEPSESN